MCLTIVTIVSHILHILIALTPETTYIIIISVFQVLFICKQHLDIGEKFLIL